MKIIIASLIIALSIVFAGFLGRLEVTAVHDPSPDTKFWRGGFVWVADGWTGEVQLCDYSGCMLVNQSD